VLGACPDAQWRLIFALCRYGGLRCPSEVLALRWDCVLWDKRRLVVPSPKTERFDGHAERVIPLYYELLPHLEAVWEQAEEGVPWVITRYRDSRQNLRTTLTKIIRRAGLVPWPKLFQSLRSTRAIELASQHPAHVAAAFMGHSTVVASKHYWRVTDADFERALGPGEPEKKTTQNPTQQMQAKSGDVQKDITHTKDADHSLPYLHHSSLGCSQARLPSQARASAPSTSIYTRSSRDQSAINRSSVVIGTLAVTASGTISLGTGPGVAPVHAAGP